MKKIVAIVFALMFALVMIAGCAQPAATAPAGEAAPAAEAPAAEAPAAEAPAAEPAGEAKVLKVACFKPEGDFMCEQLLRVCRYVEENSGGSIKFEYYLGGTFCSMPEEFGYVSSGAIDMCALMEGAGQAAAMLSLFQFTRVADTCAESVKIANTLLNEDAETSPLLLDQAAQNKIMPLGYSIAGLDAFISSKDADSLAAMSKYTFGVSRNPAYFEALGLNVVALEMSDTYEALSRGMVDATSTPINNVVTSKLYEVAPYVLISKSGGCSGLPTLCLDTWNSLTAEQQQLFRDGYAAAAEWAAAEYDTLLEGWLTELKNAGATIYYMSDEETQLKKNVDAQSYWNSGAPVAEQQGVLDQFTLIYDKAAAMNGSTFTK